MVQLEPLLLVQCFKISQYVFVALKYDISRALKNTRVLTFNFKRVLRKHQYNCNTLCSHHNTLKFPNFSEYPSVVQNIQLHRGNSGKYPISEGYFSVFYHNENIELKKMPECNMQHPSPCSF